MPLIRKARDQEAVAPPDLLAIKEMLEDGSADERWVAARSACDITDGAKLLSEALARERDTRVREAIFAAVRPVY